MERQAIRVRGLVQGVGFRPFVHGLACRLQLKGFVKNRMGSVLIEVEGKQDTLDRFLFELQCHAPPLSRIDAIKQWKVPVLGESGFRIEPSDRNSMSEVFISPDAATCADCLAELFEPADRRFRYPFLNCTNCGPRLTIIQAIPYDRERTTMARFVMCPTCRAEYEDPGNRRFHAQPIACPACGPRLAALKPTGGRIETSDPLAVFVETIMRGGIGALKGLGGFHLVCDARNDSAVRELRRRKHRDEKPFAVMVANVEAARRFCEVSAYEQELLVSRHRPIVLLRKRPSTDPRYLAHSLAPGNPFCGVILPYSPLHHLLMDTVGTVPLVMTSGNRSHEPIAYVDDEAVQRLGDITDIILTHDRPIHVRCEDSVTRILGDLEVPMRRSRGYAPQPIQLPSACPFPMLAVGGQLKSVFALGRERQAFLSHHLGDLDYYDAYRAFQNDIRLYESLFGIKPELIIHDLHPDYASTEYARQRAVQAGIECFAVQHHHAHMASCMVDRGLDEPVIGVSWDGTGYGADQAIWGGEFLVGDYLQFSRAAHLRYVRMPGGDKAIREPWRMAAAHLTDAGCDPEMVTRSGCAEGVTKAGVRAAAQMIARGFNSPFTSSAGRLFDAVATIAGVAPRVSYEGQAAMQLEWLATDVPEDGVYPFEIANVIDTRPMIREVVQDLSRHVTGDVIARRFHSTMVAIIVAVCERIRSQCQLETVVLSGGVFLNAILAREAGDQLKSIGFRVYQHRQVPPNDGGLSLGQLAIAARTYSRGSVHAPIVETGWRLECTE